MGARPFDVREDGGVSLVAAGVEHAAPSASLMEVLKQGVVAAVLGVVSVNVHQV